MMMMMMMMMMIVVIVIIVIIIRFITILQYTILVKTMRIMIW